MPVPVADADAEPPLPPLAGGAAGPRALRPLIDAVLDTLATGARDRAGPLPPGGPAAVAATVRRTVGAALPAEGTGVEEALRVLVHAVAAGAADPADPHCAAHLHCPPLAVAVAADLAASALNPSLDSWDQAPAASELEALTSRALAEVVYPATPTADALITTGGTESNQLALLLAREAARSGPAGPLPAPATRLAARPAARTAAAPRDLTPFAAPTEQLAELPEPLTGRAPDHPAQGPHPASRPLPGPRRPPGSPHPGAHPPRAPHAPPALRVVCGENAHHSVIRAAWVLGLPDPIVVATPHGVLEPAAVAAALAGLPAHAPLLVVATAGTTDSGAIDPLPALADVAAAHGARFHVDAAYGGPLLLSDVHAAKLRGIERAHTVTLDLHKLGWQPVAAGLLAVPDRADLAPLGQRADYLSADDDTEAGFPDLLGRSWRTTRRPDVLKVAVTLRALGRTGLAALIDRTCAAAQHLADLITAHPDLELHSRPTISTVLFRPVGADPPAVARARRRLLTEGRAVLGRAARPDGLWLKATLLNPHTQPSDLEALVKLVEGHRT
ncbi:pyridoxal phosphate-dependent decarboxylase family protein [Streptomyces sp. 796.1]|uniref:pyridoxal phosphate-dependent decarboxylase family protein n=1 Tax=Streptomyces sp. 796.1 TaxID=3163029 RepID=UPI0039C9AE2A